MGNRIQQAYGVGGPTIQVFPVPIISERAPVNGQDVYYPQGQEWWYNSAGSATQYFYEGNGTWSLGSAGDLNGIAADSGTATPSSGVITISGGTTGLTTTASGSTVDLTGTLIVGNGGTGATTLTGLVLGNGTSAMTSTTYTAAGAFTPAITLGTPGSSSFTYGTRVGRYTRLGAVVYFTATIPWSAFSVGSGSGTLSVNLPVTAGAFANAGLISIASSSGIDIASETANYPVNFVGVVGSGATSVLIQAQEQGSSQGATALFSVTAAQLASGGGSITLSGFYFAA